METLNYIDNCKGTGSTSLITLILPPNTQLSLISQKLTREFGTASNIKDRSNRQSVLDAIKSCQEKLKLIKELPSTGLAIYSGWYL